MKYNEVIKEVGRGKDGATDLTEETAHALYAAMLDGTVPDLELGALLISFRIKGESLEEMLGFSRAMQERLVRLEAPAGRALPVVLPSYNGARREANLTPLLALLLARQGVPTLVHGVTEDPKRVTSAEVFAALGIAPCSSGQMAQDALKKDNIAFLPVRHLSPGLENLLGLRWRLGVRNSTHALVKLADPFHGQSLRLASVTHPAYLERLSEFFQASQAHALLLRGCEGEVYANPKRRPRMTYFHNGQQSVLVEAEEGSVATLPALAESMDAIATACWTERVLAGEVEVPAPLQVQVDRCVQVCNSFRTRSAP